MTKLFFCCLFLSALSVKAQLSDHPTNGEGQIRVFYKLGIAYNEVKYPDAVAAGVSTIDFDITKSNYEKGGYQASHRWPILGDLAFPAFMEVIGFIKSYDATPGISGTLGSTGLGCLIFGWHNHAWAIISNERINIAGGLHWGDYSYYFQEFNEPDRYFSNNPLEFEDAYADPSGYYGALGPALIADLAITSNLLIHYEGAYAFSFRMTKPGDNDDPAVAPNPIFINQQLELRWRKFFTGIEYAFVPKHEEASHAGRRAAFILGYSF